MRVLVVAFVMLATVAGQAQVARPRADVTPLVEGSVRAGSTARVALKVTVPEGLHTQSNKPRDPSLIAARVMADPPEGATLTEIVWPAPIDFKQAGFSQPLAVFEREFLVGVQIAIAPTLSGEIIVPVKLRYQACDEKICYLPATAETAWRISVVPPGARAVPDRTLATTFSGIKFGTGEKPEAAPAAPPVKAAAAPRNAAGEVALLDDFTIANVNGGYLSTSEFLTFIRNAEAGVKERGMFEGRGPLAIVLLVLLGGLALNLTPCVLPMIPINLAIIGAGAQARSRSRGFVLGAAYGSAMAVVYGVLGVVVVLTAGTFGTINASPWFNLGIAVLFVVLGLAMFDLLLIDFSKYSTAFSTGGERGSVLVAFSMGAVAALLAGACVAPVVIQVVLFSSNLYATGTPIALALPFCLGLGMAIPWPIAGAGLAALPKPGAWMVKVKYAFGVFILVTAAYYAYVAYGLMANRWVDPSAVTAEVQEKLKSGWHASLADGLRTAEQTRTPVLLDLWATWCKNCLVMDRTTLADPAVIDALDGYTKIKFQAEDPDASPAREVMEHVGAIGLPHYVILYPK
jgi:thiol:disulfide interchange protein